MSMTLRGRVRGGSFARGECDWTGRIQSGFPWSARLAIHCTNAGGKLEA